MAQAPRDVPEVDPDTRGQENLISTSTDESIGITWCLVWLLINITCETGATGVSETRAVAVVVSWGFCWDGGGGWCHLNPSMACNKQKYNVNHEFQYTIR